MEDKKEKSSFQKAIEMMDEMNKNRKPQEYDWGYMSLESKKKLDDAFRELFEKQNKR